MIQRDYLIVGAGIGGGALCESLREYDPKGSVTMVGNESIPPYYRPRLFPGLLKTAKPKLESLLYQPRAWYEEHRVELRLETLITQLNLERRLAVLQTGQVIEFRKAALAMGSRARRPQVAGATLGGIHYLRHARDVLALKEMLPGQKRIVLIGGGFVATEAAALLKSLGHPVEIMSRHPTLWQHRLDPDTARWLTEWFASQGVPLLHETLNGFEGKTVLRNIQTKGGNRIPASLAILAMGSEPNLGLVSNTPLGTPNGTPVNELFETDEKGIYAVGDIALYPDPVFGGVRRCEHWETTLEQARIAGANITGRKRQRYRGLPSHTCTLFDTRFDFVGDFRQPPLRYELEGEYARRSFTARYYQGNKLAGVLLCNQSAQALEAAQEAILHAHRKD